MANIYESIGLGEVLLEPTPANPPFTAPFNVGNWSLVGDFYEISVTQGTHLRGTALGIQVFELVGVDYKEVIADTEVMASGDVKVTISSNPDLRFAGRITIIGE